MHGHQFWLYCIEKLRHHISTTYSQCKHHCCGTKTAGFIGFINVTIDSLIVVGMSIDDFVWAGLQTQGPDGVNA